MNTHENRFLLLGKQKKGKIMNTLVKKISKYYKRLDKGLLIAVTVCALIGVIMLYSMYKVGIGDIEKRTYIIQLISTGLGIAVCFIIASIDYHHLVKLRCV